ncbi:MAG: hypothetical protein IKT68_02765 [Clostridia bacterium]|nr:hypothetical protein [Clostridia bacterium]
MAQQTPSNDFYNMQREAERRVMEMQRRAKQRVESDHEPSSPDMPPSAQPPTKKQGFLEMLNLKSLFEGKDTSLVLMVLALLNNHDTDPLLLLALLYVIM